MTYHWHCFYCSSNWSYGGLVMTNLCVALATDPKVMPDASALIEAGNNRVLMEWAQRTTPKLYGLGATKDGVPRYPMCL